MELKSITAINKRTHLLADKHTWLTDICSQKSKIRFDLFMDSLFVFLFWWEYNFMHIF